MPNINEILARAAALRDETRLNSISPDRAGGIMYDTLIALNELWLSQGAALVISKIYASVAAMEADTSPVSDLTGLPLRPGQIVCIASSDSDNGSVYRYNGTSSPSWSEVGAIGEVAPVDSLDSDSTSRPLAAHQGKVLSGEIESLRSAGYLYNGVATPSTDPGTPTEKVFYIAATAGTYTNLGGLVLADGEVSVLKYNGTAWSKDATGIASSAALSQLQTEFGEKFIMTGYPARIDLSESASGAFRGYKYDVSELYDKGVRYILFRGSSPSELGTNSITAGLIIKDDNTVEITARSQEVAEHSDWLFLPITEHSKTFYGTYCYNGQYVSNPVFTPSKIWFFTKDHTDLVNVINNINTINGYINTINGNINTINGDISDINGRISTPKVIQTPYPARVPASETDSGYFKGYQLDLTGLYDKGYRAIVFRGATFTLDGNIYAGIICDSENNVLTSIRSTTENTNEYFILPITEQSKLFWGSICKNANGGEVFSVSCVHLIDIKTYQAIMESEDISELQHEIEILQSQVGFPKTFLPKKIYGVIGDTLQIFKRGMIISQTPYTPVCEFVSQQGKEFERYLEITPALSGGTVPSGLTIKHQLIDNNYNKSEQKTSDFVLANVPTSPASVKNVLCIGASTTADGEWASELKRRLIGTGGAPAGNQLSNISFVGRKELSASGNERPVAIKVEATGGWTWGSFYTPQNAIRLNVSGVASVNIGDVYSYLNANNQTVRVVVAEVNVTAGSGNIRFLYNYNTDGTGVPADASGTITRVSGSGDSTIAYSSASEETYCPFYDENNPGTKADFANYASLYCNNQIDVAIFNIGNINSGLIGNVSMTAILSQMKIMLDGLHEDFPNCKVIIAPGIGYNTHDGVEYNYGAASEFRTWGLLFAQFKYAKAIEDFISDNNYKDWCFLANTIAEVDSENVFPTTTKAVNTRMPNITEVIGTNGAHPLLSGYKMTADSIYRCFVNVVL